MGVDIDSGALVRVHRPTRLFAAAPSGPPEAPLEPYEVVRMTLWAGRDDFRPEQPEAVVVQGPYERVGRLSHRSAERYIKPLLHPQHWPLLGFNGPAVPFWELDADRPSVAIVAPGTRLRLVHHPKGLRCQFGWQGRPHSLTVNSPSLEARLPAARHPSGAVHVEQVVGFEPHRLVVAFSSPFRGLCYKVIAGFLPHP